MIEGSKFSVLEVLDAIRNGIIDVEEEGIGRSQLSLSKDKIRGHAEDVKKIFGDFDWTRWRK